MNKPLIEPTDSSIPPLRPLLESIVSQQSSHTSVRQRAVLPWIWQFLKPYRLRVVAAIVFLLIGSLAWLSLGQGVRLMVDEGFIKDNAQRLNEIILLVLLITAVSGTAVFCRFYLMTWLGSVSVPIFGLQFIINYLNYLRHFMPRCALVR